MQKFDVIVIGGGIAGISTAYEVSSCKSVLVLEAEDHYCYHASGRSAAAYIQSYGYQSYALRNLTFASFQFLHSPDEAFHPTSFLSHRGLIHAIDVNSDKHLTTLFNELSDSGSEVEILSKHQVVSKIPAIKHDYQNDSVYEHNVYDIDTHELHQAYLKGLRANGGQIKLSSPVTALQKTADGWKVTAGQHTFFASIVVNAAGAWSANIAQMANAQPLAITPKRRTAIIIDPGQNTTSWPLFLDVDKGFYFKTDAGKLMVSPGDEHDSSACDAQPEDIDIAIAAYCAEQGLDISVKKIEHKWAGLRSFADDRIPVIGFDINATGFFWMCGQGGHGFQIAPAAAQVAASLINNVSLPSHLSDFEVDSVSPHRFVNPEVANG